MTGNLLSRCAYVLRTVGLQDRTANDDATERDRDGAFATVRRDAVVHHGTEIHACIIVLGDRVKTKYSSVHLT